MPYSIPWDETEPVGATTPAADIDEELQELKVSIRERMNNIVGAGNWEDDLVDPKILFLPMLLVTADNVSTSGTVATTPSNLTENVNSGQFTVGATDITIDVDGKYLAIIVASVGVTTPAGGESINLTLTGTATINSFSGLWVAVATESHTHSLVAMTLVTATAGQTLVLNHQLLQSTGTNPLNLTNPRLFLLRIGN